MLYEVITDSDPCNVVITRTWTLKDDCNNTTTHDQIINVVDKEAPTFTAPADVTINCEDDVDDLSLTGDVTDELDNCDVTLEATYSDAVRITSYNVCYTKLLRITSGSFSALAVSSPSRIRPIIPSNDSSVSKNR